MELLAPAGDFTCLQAAVQNGADAVYIGGGAFSARTGANRFGGDALLQAVDYAHIRGCKVYLALNTLIKDAELPAACTLAQDALRTGVDALIIQDLGMAAILAQAAPDMRLHASTQMTLRDLPGVQMAQRLGFRRAILARETPLADIRAIAAQTDCELEVFVHGALCMCYSGQCLMSSMIGGRSGNRGSCAQPCRLPYTLYADGKAVTKAMPILSPKDLCLIDRLNDLRDAGVCSIKIEGRLKSPEYVGMVTKVYRAALTDGARQQDIDDMLSFFSRGGSCRGFIDGVPYREMMDYGQGAKITANHPLEKQIQQSFAPGAEQAKIAITAKLTLCAEAPSCLTLSTADGVMTTVEGAPCEPAIHVPLDAQRAQEQLCKLGGTPFEASRGDITIQLPEGVTLPIKELNRMRREGCAALEQAIAARFRRDNCVPLPVPPAPLPTQPPTLTVRVTTAEQYQAAAQAGVGLIYAPIELCGKIEEQAGTVYALPPVGCDPEWVKRKLGNRRALLAENIGQLECFQGYQLYGGMRLNAFNSQTLARLNELGIVCQQLSPELNLRELRALSSPLPVELTVYGHMPLMITENCFIKSAYRCICGQHTLHLIDRKGERFPVLTQNCRNIILNSKPIYMADRLHELADLKINQLNLYFTVENPKKCGKIIEEYKQAMTKPGSAPSDRRAVPNAAPADFTRGHLYRGVQ